jgi:hypothetical protein
MYLTRLFADKSPLRYTYYRRGTTIPYHPNSTGEAADLPWFDRKSGKLCNYYYQRGAKKLKRRVVDAGWIFNRPMEWPEPEILASGEEKVAYDAGNVSTAVIGKTHYPAFYSGSSSDTSVFVLPVPAP